MIHQDFIDEMKKILPTDEIDSFLQACSKPLKKSISVCTGKISVQDFVETTKKRWRYLTPSRFHPETWSFYIDRDDVSNALGRTFLYQAGFFYIQELAASLPASQIQSKPWDLILDMAAAPGGKSTQLAHALLERSSTQWWSPWLIISNDIAPLRVKTMAHNLNLMGCYNTAITQRNGGMFWKHLPEVFDHVLLDAPCSGEWTKFKSDDALSFRRKEDINKITGTQFQLLVSAVKTTKVGGTVLYSTCTLNPYENEEILQRILEFFPETLEIEQVQFHELSSGITPEAMSLSFDPNKVARCRPHRQGTGGFFVSKIKKIKTTNKQKLSYESKLQPKNPFSLDMSKGLFKRVGKSLEENYGILLDSTIHLLVASKDKVYLCSPDLIKLQWLLQFEKAGIPILKIDNDTYRPTHHLGQLLGHLAKKNVITLDDAQMQAYCDGNEIDVTLTRDKKSKEHPYRIIQRNGYGMSVLKINPDGIKNKWWKL